MKKNPYFYFTEEGIKIYTAQYHLKRGYCCGAGCQHCPFDHINVPSDRKIRMKNPKRNP